MKTEDGNQIICSECGKVCYTEREAGGIINDGKRHFYYGHSHLVKSGYSNSKNIPKRKYFCRACGFYHVSHFSCYSVSSANSTWEDLFYEDIAKKAKIKAKAC